LGRTEVARADMEAAQATEPRIAADFARYGLTP